MQATELVIEGMTCASCVRRIEKALTAVDGAESAAVNLATGRAHVQHREGLDHDALTEAVRRAGYLARVEPDEPGDDPPPPKDETRELKRSLAVAAAATVPLVVLEMGGHMVPAFHAWLHGTLGHEALSLVLFALATVVQLGPGLRFHRQGLRALAHGAPDMSSLVSLGTTAAYGYSVVATFFPAVLPAGAVAIYFEASAVIVTLVLLGRWLEALGRGRASEAIGRLVRLQAPTARVVRGADTVDLPIAAVRPGDLVLVRPGERLPVDGEVTEGRSWVDASMVTGEPVPVLREPGDEVVGGTLNRQGSFTFRVTRVGKDTLLARLIHLVEEAQAAKLPIQALVDRVTAWFVPAVMALAALTFGVWLAFGPEPALSLAVVNAVAVLIIACPCAMGLATPTSILVGTGRAAELGVLFRKGDALQTLAGVGVVALDKTGTLTEGRPAVTDVLTLPGWAPGEVLRLAAALEARSEHPLAEAVVRAAATRGLTVPPTDRFEALPGHGVVGEVEGHEVAVGAARLLTHLGLDAGPFEATLTDLATEGRTPILVAVDGCVAAVLGLSDPIRPEAPEAIRQLQALGLEVVMVTGDHLRVGEAVARRLGISTVVADVLPDGKAEAVRALRAAAAGRGVAFVGDGLNDAPALAEADVGLAVGSGTDVAIESAEVVLSSGDIRGVATAVALSRATLSNIRQNLFWAFAYNAALIPVAAGALHPLTGTLLSPVLAAAAMGLSSLFVLGNALRLRRFSPPVSLAPATSQVVPGSGSAERLAMEAQR